MAFKNGSAYLFRKYTKKGAKNIGNWIIRKIILEKGLMLCVPYKAPSVLLPAFPCRLCDPVEFFDVRLDFWIIV